MLKLLKIIFHSLPFLLGSMLSANATDLAGSEWGIEKPIEQFIKFSVDNRVSGHAGCNRFFGSYSLDKSKGTITIDPLASTKKACEQSLMRAEWDFLKKLEKSKKFKRKSRNLELLDKDSKRLLSLAWRDFD